MNQNVFNKAGDFITSPEISQLFGEMLAIWIQVFWEKLDLTEESNKTIVEVGPGTGKLMKNILNSLEQFGSLSNLKVIFVEVSPYLRKLQQQTINEFCNKHKFYLQYESNEVNESLYYAGKNMEFVWYESYNEFALNVKDPNPSMHMLFLCHEFFDALPAFKFVFNKGKWHEKLVDLNTAKETILLDTQKTPSGLDKVFKTSLSEPNSSNVDHFLKPEYRFHNIPIAEGTEFEVSPLCKLTSKCLRRLDGRSSPKN
jgi:NADH dehydrogenase [ubiquinone] 1 alpha subcomplex assembly factor 7